MKILYWTGGFWPRTGGVETYSLQWIEAMQKRGHQFIVLADKSYPNPKDRETHRNIPIQRFAFDRILGHLDPKNLRPIREYLEWVMNEYRPDIIHLNMSLGWGSLLFLLFRNRISMPVILTVHSSFFSHGKDIPLIEKFCSSVDQICCVSQSILNEIENHLPGLKSKLRLAYCGLALPEMAPLPLPFTPPVLLLLGRLRSGKGFDTALRAFSLLKKRGSKARLLIAGAGDERPCLENLANELGLVDVEWMGEVTRDCVPSLINRATLLLVPSYFEAFGLVALEAMQMERPVISSRIGGLTEIVSHCETGLLVPPKDPVALCQAVLELLNQPEQAKRMGIEGRKRAANFTLEQSVTQYEELFMGMMAR